MSFWDRRGSLRPIQKATVLTFKRRFDLGGNVAQIKADAYVVLYATLWTPARFQSVRCFAAASTANGMRARHLEHL